MIFCNFKSIYYMYMWFWIKSMSVISVITTLTSMCCRTSLYISTAILWTRWLQLLYMMALVNMSIISRWNSAVDRIAPLSMFFLIWLRSIRLRERNYQPITDQFSFQTFCWTSLSVFDWFENKWIGIFMCAGTCIQIKVHFMTSLCYLWTMVVYPGAISFVTGWRNTLAYLKKQIYKNQQWNIIQREEYTFK